MQRLSCTRDHHVGTTLQHTATHCNTLQHTATGELQKGAHYWAPHCNELQTLQQVNIVQHTAPSELHKEVNPGPHTATGGLHRRQPRAHYPGTHCNTLHHTAIGELHEGAPSVREDRAIESTNTVRVRATGALHAHAVARHVDGVLCAVVAASRRLVVPRPHSIVIEIGDAIRHALHAAERIAIHVKPPVHETRE